MEVITMKKIEAIIRPEKLAEVRKALENIGYPGMMISKIEGHGKQRGKIQKWRGEEYRCDILLKTRLELIVKNKDVAKITKTIIEIARTGEIGDGKIFIYPLDEAIRIRTGEKGEEML
jgi:nitrogen regulatory protein P-II 1